MFVEYDRQMDKETLTYESVSRQIKRELQLQCVNKPVALIDVREPDEYDAYHIGGSINVPSSRFHNNMFEEYRDAAIVLICSSGVRARSVANKLDLLGYADVQVAKQQMSDMINNSSLVRKAPQADTQSWTVDRQFRLVLGMALAVYLLLAFAGITWGIFIPVIIASGLLFSSIIDRCYLRSVLARLPWNRS